MRENCHCFWHSTVGLQQVRMANRAIVKMRSTSNVAAGMACEPACCNVGHTARADYNLSNVTGQCFTHYRILPNTICCHYSVAILSSQVQQHSAA